MLVFVAHLKAYDKCTFEELGVATKNNAHLGNRSGHSIFMFYWRIKTEISKLFTIRTGNMVFNLIIDLFFLLSEMIEFGMCFDQSTAWMYQLNNSIEETVTNSVMLNIYRIIGYLKRKVSHFVSNQPIDRQSQRIGLTAFCGKWQNHWLT